MFFTIGLQTSCAMVADKIDRVRLEKALIDAHTRGDGTILAELYERAADMSEADGDTEAASFFLTQALVFALQEGLDNSKVLRARLHTYGREAL